MPNLPIRDLGKVGVITDINPHDLPLNGFSDGRNIVFNENRVLRAPVFKTLFNQTTQTAQTDIPLSVFNYNHPSNGSMYVVANADNSVTEYNDGVSADVHPAAVTPSGNDQSPWTHAEVAGLTILCRGSSEPYVRDPVADTRYSLMSVGDWPTADRARTMRTFRDFIIALNVTESGTTFDTKVKWCDILQYRASLSTGVVWTPTASNNAGSNILTNFTTPLVDGMELGNQFVIYSSTESAIMEYTGSQFVFSFRNLFDRDGVINVNCIASTGREHYVFGDTDIYKHDGVRMQSVANNRVRERIYSEINRTKLSKCFVHLDEVNDLIYFCYVSDESDIAYVATNYCNKAAVYNLKTDTWSFVDLPNVAGAAFTNTLNAGQLYSNAAGTYQTLNANFASFADNSPRISAFAAMRDDANGHTAGRVYANDMLFTGLTNAAVEPEALNLAFLERRGLDLDETQAPLRAYKHLLTCTPQIVTVSGTDPVTVKLGSTDLAYDDSPNYVTSFTFYPNTHHKIDTKASGRLLAYRIEEPSGVYFNFSAADFDVDTTSGR